MTLLDQMKQLPHHQYIWAYWKQLKDAAVTLNNDKDSLQDDELCLYLQDSEGGIFAAPNEKDHAKESEMVKQLFKYVTNNMEQLKASYINVRQRTISLLYTSYNL
jgi:hypothetical protein